MLEEFKKFALKGNLVDMAVAFVMGAGFTKLSTAFINDFIMPIVGWATPGNLDFSNKYWVLKETNTIPKGTPLAQARESGAVMAYGEFISVALDFLILAVVMFMIVKAINKAKSFHEKSEAPAAPAKPSNQEVLLAEIRDLLKK